MTASVTTVGGRLVLDERVEAGRLEIEGDRIASVTLDAREAAGDVIAPGFVDVHIHGGGGHDAMGDLAALDGLSRHLLRHGVTSFLPTAVTVALDDLVAFAERVRGWLPNAPTDGADPLGFNLEGPFLAPARRGAQDPAHLRVPADVPESELESLVQGLRLVTIAPELPGALELIAWLCGRGVSISLGHSAATADQARAGFQAGATSTTHLFNAMTGVDHRAPGVAVAALLEDAAYVELIADGIHVDPALWPMITRLKPSDRLILVSDAIALAGLGDGQDRLGALTVVSEGGRVTLAGTDTLAGSLLTLDVAVRNVVAAGWTLPDAVAAASRKPLAMLGVTDRGRISPGQRADLVELDAELRVRRVMRGGRWLTAGAT
jgi:N-acetylglucosamine-6-phosphate deacetylase